MIMHHNYNHNHNHNNKRLHRYGFRYCSTNGYILFLTVLIAGVVLLIGMGAMNVIRKEIILSGFARESQFAFYAADGGIECGLYWDLKHVGFGTTAFATSTSSNPPGVGAGVLCNGQDIKNPAAPVNHSVTYPPPPSQNATTQFSLSFSDGTCATVIVRKTNSGLRTRLESRGYNTCDLSSPRRIERAIRVSY